jgi:fluoride exporter
MVRFLWICLGGAVGTGARYLISGWAARFGASFPYGTLAVTSSARSRSERSCTSP